MTVPIRKSAVRQEELSRMVEDTDAGRPYRFAAAIEPRFYGMLLDAGMVETRDVGTHPVGGRRTGVFITDAGRALLARWSSS